jgi:hypothetical protein
MQYYTVEDAGYGWVLRIEILFLILREPDMYLQVYRCVPNLLYLTGYVVTWESDE